MVPYALLNAKVPLKHAVYYYTIQYSKLHKKIPNTTDHQTKENVLNQVKEIENNLKM